MKGCWFWLLTGLVLVAGGCAGPGMSRMEQPQAVAEIAKLGGRITVDEKAPGKPVIGVNLSDAAITDATLVYLEGLPHLRQLDLGHTQRLRQATITDAGLAHVEGLVELRRLSLARTGISDAGLEHLNGLTRLESLNLEYTRVSDAGLGRLTGLTKLQRLKLKGSLATEAGVKRLQEALPGCRITLQ